MVTLGIETSCDETSAALVETVWGSGPDPNAAGAWRFQVLSNVVSSQVQLHAAYGGVVPELAARSHVERLPRVVEEALNRAGVGLAVYALAVWPANFKHAIDGVDLPFIANSWLYHGPRLALQPVIAWWALYCAEIIGWPWRRQR